MSKIEQMILDRDFKYLRPCFYNNKWALRCELGIGADEEFAKNAKRRATEIYNILFPQGADAIIFNYWFTDYSTDGPAHLDGYGDTDVAERMKYILDYEFDQLRFLLEHEAQYRHLTLRSLPTDELYVDIKIDGGLPLRHRVICYSDGREFDTYDIIDRQIGETFGHDISFVSFENECILSIYDSRGCDIVFATQEKMKEFYHTLEPYFLDYDRAEMERRYKENENV